ncbi:Shikimate dehydrogenase [Microstroma glucosiphilum]|uniref:Pentafunctional AROM polypeptide n=1 Tax=Pseudomicrostroma glucosiphilum TaxID=1684307 RepID=A0A316U9C5_9BASI|nr:Shikimate dehydrogenase [Pseudomicrostroma glucosiphilum]PWN21454.1 Shikimate dehydrogenase [Pseudomicrostroma glucosiphilum]
MTSATGSIAGQKEASYHRPPVESQIPSGQAFTIHKLQCLDSQIHLGFHILPHVFHTIITELKSSTYVFITDSNLEGIYGETIRQEWKTVTSSLPAPPRLLTYTLPPGETSKSRQVKEQIEDWMLSQHCVRDTVLIAFGGGVIGDLSGFVAATFMRGIKYVQVPTTLLAMVDSAVGGKTAVDTPHGKNLIGAFHQPRYIFIDAGLLRTLPEREFSNGMAEVVKTAAIWDAADFAKLESSSDAIRAAVLSKDAQATATQGRHSSDRSVPQSLLLDVIRGSVGVKAHIVTIDEKETGLRNLVNFGHSIGHAIEAILTPDMLHGECVSIGMILEAELSRRLSGFAQVNLGRLAKVLKAYNLPVSLNDPRVTSLDRARGLSTESVIEVMRMDKKNVGTTKKIVLLRDIGQCHEDKASSVEDDIIRRVLAHQVKVSPLASPTSASSGSAASAPTKLSTPGSKSISNRALVLAALAKGTTRLRNLLHSDDTGVMMTGLAQLQAAKFDWEEGGEVVVVHGNGGSLQTPEDGTEIYLQNAGTAARFMASVVALARDAQGQGRPTIITGNARMKERPIAPLVAALRSNGVAINHTENDGFLPLAVSGESGFKGGRIELSASISSQYVSSILLAAPLAREFDVLLELVGGKVISQPYIDMTIAMMKDFGAKVERLTDEQGKLTDSYRIARGGYTSPGAYDVESDASSATYPLAFAAITGRSVVVEKIGSASLQGDARFATDVLRPMGCDVTQTRTETHVTGPASGQLHHFESGDVDMEPMTDAFLTAAVLLAVAAPHPTSGAKSTRIRGIANQRVKECNRIQAMMDQLAKFGVKTVEHEDGLEVFGMDRASMTKDIVSVHCYDDHRVAMAFSVLATVVPSQTILEEKRCVEKTWPNWWDDLESKLGVKVAGVDSDLIPSNVFAKSAGTASAAELTKLDDGLSPRAYHPEATMFLIGMRASGKSYLGRMAATALGRRFIDADVLFEERLGHLGTYVAEKGWPEFRLRESEILIDLMDNHSSGYVISLGGGVVEDERNRSLLTAYARSRGPVVHTVRALDEIKAFLSTSGRPAWGEPLETVWSRRRPRFTQCSSLEIVNFRSPADPAPIADLSDSTLLAEGANSSTRAASSSIVPGRSQEAAMARVFRFITGQHTNQVDLTALDNKGNPRTSYLLTLTFPDILPALPLLDEITSGADALELRVDLLSPTGTAATAPTVPPKEFVALQLTALRQWSGLPIVFTVRTHSQGGMFPDDAEEEYFDLVKMALRMGVEYIDLEIGWPRARLAAVKAQKGHTKILASWHDWSGDMKWTSPSTWDKCEQAAAVGDVVKLVGKAVSPQDNLDLEAFRRRVAQSISKPLLAINTSTLGQMSRILNPNLSLITHLSMPTPGAPGQLSFAEVQRARSLLGLLPKQKFTLFGKPVAHSLSPLLHNTAFGELGLPHHYERVETDVINDAVKDYIRSDNFGGASVTIPLKLDIIPLLDELTEDARAIGAVNTIIPIKTAGSATTKLIGDNTDWIAIRALCVKSLPLTVRGTKQFTALVIGAGGSARAALYAAHKVGVSKIYLYNRTRENALKLQRTLPADWSVEVVDTLDESSFGDRPPQVIISNVPADGTSLDASSGAGVILPRSILTNAKGGVVVDMSYKPHHTPLLELVRLENERHEEERQDGIAGAEKRGKWVAVPGLTILLEQGCHQFSKWTGREAPRKVVEETCWKQYLAQ